MRHRKTHFSIHFQTDFSFRVYYCRFAFVIIRVTQMNSSVPLLSTKLNQIQEDITRYFLVPTYVFGNLGNVANIILFGNTNLRTNNICAWYFIGVSMMNIIGLNFGGLTRILALLNGFTLESTSIVFCKTRNYFIQTAAIIGRYFLCLISIERWMVTSSNDAIRRMSSPKIAQNLIIFGVITLVLFNAHVVVGFEIRMNRCNAFFTQTYQIFFNVYNMIIICVPITIMSLFSILVLFNIHQSRSRFGANSSAVSSAPRGPSKAARQRDMQFIRIAFVQVLVFLISTISYGIFNVYSLLTSSQMKSADQRAIDSFLGGLTVNLNYASISVTFFTYTLASKTFRKECITSVIRAAAVIRRQFKQ